MPLAYRLGMSVVRHVASTGEKEFNKLVQNTRSLSWLYFSRYGQWIEPLEMGRWWRQAVVSRAATVLRAAGCPGAAGV